MYKVNYKIIDKIDCPAIFLLHYHPTKSFSIVHTIDYIEFLIKTS